MYVVPFGPCPLHAKIPDKFPPKHFRRFIASVWMGQIERTYPELLELTYDFQITTSLDKCQWDEVSITFDPNHPDNEPNNLRSVVDLMKVAKPHNWDARAAAHLDLVLTPPLLTSYLSGTCSEETDQSPVYVKCLSDGYLPVRLPTEDEKKAAKIFVGTARVLICESKY